MIRFMHPWAFALLALVPLCWWLWLRARRRPVIRYSSVEGLRRAGARYGVGPRSILYLLRSVAILALIVAVARPQRADETSRIHAEGVAVQLVIDTSGSMDDKDLSPPGRRLSRLDVVKDVVRRFVAGEPGGLPGRPNDLIGLIRFAQYADSVCPLTLDHANVLEVIDALQIVRTREEDGTAIGDGLALAVERLKDLVRTTGSGERLKIVSRVVILLTDGQNNAGIISPVQAGELAARFGIKVYTILAGSGADMGFGMRAPVQDEDLRHIAAVSGGQHFRATDKAALERVYEQIDQLERTRVEEQSYVRWGELSAPWLLAAFAALSLQTLLDATLLRKIP